MKVSRSAFIALLAGSTNAHQALRVPSDEAPIPAEFSLSIQRIESNDPLAKSYKTSKSSKTSKTCPSDAPVANFGTWNPYTYSRWIYSPDKEIGYGWFINTDCGPRGQCYQAGNNQDDYYDSFGYYCDKDEEDLVVDTDVEVRGEKDGIIEAITHGDSTTLENKFNFEEQGILTFDLFCSSEEEAYHRRSGDTCDVYVLLPGFENYTLVMRESGNLGWMSKAIVVPKGEVTIKWVYEKDSKGCSFYDDTMMLDNIQLIRYPPASAASAVVADENLVISTETSNPTGAPTTSSPTGSPRPTGEPTTYSPTATQIPTYDW